MSNCVPDTFCLQSKYFKALIDLSQIQARENLSRISADNKLGINKIMMEKSFILIILYIMINKQLITIIIFCGIGFAVMRLILESFFPNGL
jgi:hypothetical protein